MFSFFKKCKKPKEYPEVLDKVNLEVNKKIWYVSDNKNYGKSDVWVVNPENKQGDCEDYALTKQKRLIEKNIPKEDLDIQLTFFTNRNNQKEAHAVLVYKNIWVLDNLTDKIIKKYETGYFDWIENEGKRTIHEGKPSTST